MQIRNTECLQEACVRMRIPCEVIDDNGNVLKVMHEDKVLFFVNSTTPWNSAVASAICKDKYFSYKLLRSAVRMPRTISCFDPLVEERFSKYVTHSSVEDLAAAVCKDFPSPFIVKMNSGSEGRNVFLCHSKEEVAASLQAIYRKDSRSYDFIALAQEYIAPKKEYRVIVFKGDIMLVYEKSTKGAQFAGNLSPLHHTDAKAVRIEDPVFIERLAAFIAPIFEKLDIGFVGIDVIESNDGELFMLELNSNPGFSYFVRDNGKEPLVEMYQKILTK
jgi:glutathione synthase/RimK-type ligase-like ATP-grasp enzyme